MEKITGMHQPFEKWHPKNLLELCNFILARYPDLLRLILLEYDEMLRGN